MTLLEQLGKLAERGIEVIMLSATQFSVSGFYKSSSVDVDIEALTVTARYDEISSIRDNDLIQTLVDINYDWWQRSKGRYIGWSHPDVHWLPLLKEYGLVTEIKEEVVRYE